MGGPKDDVWSDQLLDHVKNCRSRHQRTKDRVAMQVEGRRPIQMNIDQVITGCVGVERDDFVDGVP